MSEQPTRFATVICKMRLGWRGWIETEYSDDAGTPFASTGMTFADKEHWRLTRVGIERCLAKKLTLAFSTADDSGEIRTIYDADGNLFAGPVEQDERDRRPWTDFHASGCYLDTSGWICTPNCPTLLALERGDRGTLRDLYGDDRVDG